MTAAVKAARVGVLGAGAVAQVAHLPILTRMRGVEIVGLYDSDQPKAAALAQRFGIPRVYPSTDAMWGDGHLDAVIICTPNHLHEAQVLDGLDSGKYVFCEKPLALTEQGCRRILAKVASPGTLMVGMNQRFRPDTAALKGFVAGGDMGEIQSVRAGWLNRRVGRSPRGWRHHKETAGGGALMDLGIQMLDLALWILDYPEPRRIVAHLRSGPSEEVEDWAILLAELDGGRVVDLEVTWTLVADRERQYLQVLGTQGSGGIAPLRAFKETQDGTVDISPQLTPARENPFTASYRQELADFVDAVRAERPIEPPAEQATLMKLVEAAYRSAELGVEVRF